MSNQQPTFPLGNAMLFNGHGKPLIESEYQLRSISSGEVIVKNLYTTLCGSDIHTYCGRRTEPEPTVLGHEIVGEVLWFNPEEGIKDYNGNDIAIGDRVVWSIFAVPAGIEAPRADMPQKSDSLFKYGHAKVQGNDVFHGGLADYCILKPNTAFLKISTDVPVQVAATISCAHATVMGALRVAGEIKGKHILIFGAGLLGISCVAMCREAGAASIGLVDYDAPRLQWATKFGVDHIYIPNGALESLPWREADIVFDMSGHPDAMKTGIESLALGGCAIWVGAVFPAAPVPVNAEKIVRKLLQIRGLHNYNYDDFVRAVAFIEQNHNKYPFESLVEKEYPLREAEQAFSFATEKKPVRVGIHI